jgi:hypothetical protein
MTRRGFVVGDGKFGYHVVGTLAHQQALEKICGGRKHRSARHYCAALLAPEPTNPYDRHAVRITVHGIEVGYLDREDARDFLPVLESAGVSDAACEAEIVGGWDDGPDDRGKFGLRLNAFMPFQIKPAESWVGAKESPSHGVKVIVLVSILCAAGIAAYLVW